MKKIKSSQIVILLIAVVVLGIAIYQGISIYNKKTNEITTLQGEKQNMSLVLQERDSMVNELLTAINDIELNLTYIKDKRQQLSLAKDQEGGIDQKKAIIEDIQLMNEMLEKSSKHIAELERKLKRSGIQISSFKKKIEALNENIENQNQEIALLQKQVEEKDIMLADLNQQVDSVKFELNKKVDTLQQKQNLIDEKIYELNKAFVAYGTFKELQENGVVAKQGGFLGIGRNTSLQRNINEDYFTQLNISETKSIPLFSSKATVVSEHPDSSYTFVEKDGVIAYLQIDDPQEFWKLSKYAVIEVKN